MFTRDALFRLALVPVALCAAGHARAAMEPDPLPEGALVLDAEAVRSQVYTPDSDAAPDLFGRSRNGFTLDMINPALRLEYGNAARGLIDTSVMIDGLSDAERAERGLASRDPGQVYDATLRFDAARIHEIAFFVSSGVRSEFDEPQADADASPFDSLRWTPVAGGGVEWRPGRGFFLAGSTLFNMDERRGAIAELTAEMGMRVTPDLSVSLGYRTLDSNFSAPTDAAEDLKDAAFAAIRLRF